MTTTRVIPSVAGTLAFVSGMSALIYQVAWAKLLALTLGSTTVAAAIVIGGFMGGMGVGARAYGWLPQGAVNHFRRYGLIELGIALSAVLVTPLFLQLPRFITDDVIAFVIALSVILIPSALMGATFPALCAALIKSIRGVNQYLGIVYGINTLGAAAGALVAGFVLIEAFGVQGACYVAVAGNLICGLVALRFSRKEATVGEPQQKVSQAQKPFSTQHHVDRWLIGTVLLGSGVATMAYEMIWIRILKYIVGNSTYAMSLVVAIFLVGLGGGGLVHRWLKDNSKNPGLLGWTQLGTAALSLCALAIVNWVLSDLSLSARFSILAPQLQQVPWWKSLLSTSLLSVVILLPPSLLMGLSFPLGSGLFVNRIQALGADLGKAYLIANIGSIVGVFLGALVLLPVLGMMSAVKVLAGLNLLLGMLVFVANPRHVRTAVWIGGVVATACLLLALFLPARLAYRGELEGPGMSRLLYWEEDEISTVKVLQHPSGEARAMTVDGYVIGSGRAQQDAVVHKQLMLAHLPMALRPDARDVLNVGLGSATTLDALGHYASLRSLTCVEISRAVVEGAELFEEGRVLQDPRTRIVVDDAVHFLLQDTTSYDLIISDCKQNFQYSGNAAILSREYYTFARARLRPAGLFVQWIPMNLPPRAFEIVLATFIEVFPHAEVHYFTPDLLLFVGGHGTVHQPEVLPIESFQAAGGQSDLAPFDITDIRQVLSGRVSGSAAILQVLRAREINSWNHPILEFVPYKEFRIEENPHYNHFALKLLNDAAERENRTAEVSPFVASSRHLRQGFEDILGTGRPDAGREAFIAAQKANPEDTRSAILLRRMTGGMRNLLSPGAPVP